MQIYEYLLKDSSQELFVPLPEFDAAQLEFSLKQAEPPRNDFRDWKVSSNALTNDTD